ncbi:MAG: PAS domain S-box-containing protein [Paracoccaceae bacterium]|jgi:PAS domain S-box-containing protein
MNEIEELQRQLTEAKGRFRSLMDNCVDAMIIIDETGAILDFNPAAEKIFQFETTEVLGKNVSILMPEPYHSAHDGYLRNYMTTGEAKIIGIGREVKGRRKDETTFPMELSVGEMPDGGTRNFVGIIRDITRRRTIETQLLQASKMEAIGQLTGGIAHDFNNLLAILTMDLEMLSDLTEDDAESAELVTEALDVTRTGADLTQRLLAFSRRQTLVPTATNINEMVLSITGLLRRTLGAGIRIDTSGPQNLWPVMIDRGQLENTLINLAINARDAMPDGGKLAITCENLTLEEADEPAFDQMPAGEYVRLTFTDTGVGMPAEVVQRAFEPFFTTKEGRHGTGLGLSMVYGFVKQSGGNVTIYSAEGSGTTINLCFPRADGVASEGESFADRPKLPVGTEDILVVEDDDRLRERSASALRTLGYKVTTAHDGHSALRRIAEDGAPDMVLTDIVMPGLDGPGLVRELSHTHPALKIMLMTGYAEASALLQEAMTKGAPMLHKPFTRRQLADGVRKLLDGQS